MKIYASMTAVLHSLGLVSLAAGICFGAQAQSPINPCLDCHSKETPEIVSQWEVGKHSKTGVKCYVCHYAEKNNSQGVEHNGFFIATAVDVATCESCHPENAAELLGNYAKGSGKHP